MTITKLEVAMHENTGNRMPMVGKAWFSDGKVYHFAKNSDGTYSLLREHHRFNSLVRFNSPERSAALLKAIDDETIHVRSAYYAH